MYIRTLQPTEVELHRELRLLSLEESPDSFGEAYADAAAKPHSDWEKRTRWVATPDGNAMFLACNGNNVLGFVSGIVDEKRSAHGRVSGMWVNPQFRRQGVGLALMQEILEWGRTRGLQQLGLFAPGHTPAALALYLHVGFVETGNRQPHPLNNQLEIVEMVRDL